MTQPHSRTRLHMAGLAVLAVMLLGTACAPSTPAAPLSTSAPPLATAAQAAQPAATQDAQAKPLDLPAGVDADGNFYLGDPDAPVKLMEFSDFQ